ncbi:glycoside hydrolase family 43 protein [Hymenobacter caeli]|uniref:Arabinan endo-1,5-alpha-L-arabinosidase n=1 Tax=Hymenobacter caeli TaxID=2735894 RepID=A0ABX2FQ46_9BACT|nr:glycoside hydrolase family 43 protein [Hymenobacter caeli]NRT18572.1 arabinan endo-1,5-alpha-L-arabinosidase [Hymenobacter caeli]
MYTNPILDDNFPDPTIIRAADGWYYAYGTQTRLADGRIVNIQVARSRDLTAWEYLGDALPHKPAWAAATQKLWAPHVSEAAGRYYLYYSARPDDAPDGALALAVAVADGPAGPFVDSGRPLLRGPGFTCIDPMAYDDPATGQRLLYWGSGFGPLWVQALAEDRVSFAPSSAARAVVQPSGPADDAANYHRLIEASWLHRRDGWYYLFFSGDNCCGPRAHYAVLVARSRAATGPFEVQPAPVVAANAHWLAPGHNCVVTDAAGQDWLAYHAIDVRRPTFAAIDDAEGYTRRALLLDRLDYDPDGWPRVAGGTPSWQPQPGPAGALVP